MTADTDTRAREVRSAPRWRTSREESLNRSERLASWRTPVLSIRTRLSDRRVQASSFRDAAQERVVLRRAHEEEHGERQPEPDTRGDESPACKARRLLGHRRALFAARARPGNQLFLHAPHHAPGVQQHQKAYSAADADAQMRVRNHRPAVQIKNDPGSSTHNGGNRNRAHP